VGPGAGALTELLAASAGRLVAVELDERFANVLRQRYADTPNVSIVQGDILRTDLGSLIGAMHQSAPHLKPGYKVVANLPYYITGAAIRHLLAADPAPDLAVLTVQREVAERIASRPPRMSLLAVSVQYSSDATLVGVIPARAFRPAPKVESGIVRLIHREQPARSRGETERFFGTVRAGFCQPRKQLRNALAAGLGVSPEQAARWLTEAGISPNRRAATLAVAEWSRLADIVPADQRVPPPDPDAPASE
jgi:16S rRNA (adenine1518-N6/adenine1519-N6)-dimethyltransferase